MKLLRRSTAPALAGPKGPSRRVYGAAGRERQKQETGARILDSAVKLFSYPEHVRMMVQESLRDSDRVRWLATTHVRRLHKPFVRCFEQASKEGRQAAFRIPSLVYGLVAASQMIFALAAEARHVYGLDVNDPEFVEPHADTVFGMLVGAFPPGAGPASTATTAGRHARASRVSAESRRRAKERR